MDNNHVRMLVSPYTRTRETAEEMLRELNTRSERWVDSVRESPFLSEMDWGCQEGDGALAHEKYAEETERNRLKQIYQGKFWARPPHGGKLLRRLFQGSGSGHRHYRQRPMWGLVSVLP